MPVLSSAKSKFFDKYERLGAYHWDGGSKDPYYLKHIDFIKQIFVQARSDYEKNLILDVGCGDGFIAKQLADLGFDVIGIDTNGYALDLAREKFSIYKTRGQVRFEHQSFFDLKEAPGFVLVSDVLEHMYNPTDLVNHLFSLNPLSVILSTPLARQDGKLWDPGYHVTEFTKEGFAELFGCFLNTYKMTHILGQWQQEYTTQYIILEKNKGNLNQPSFLDRPWNGKQKGNRPIQKPTMHCQDELEQDLGYGGFIPDALIFKWFNAGYSASRHLFTLYSVARGLNAKTIVEIGFGRSSFVLARAAYENGGRLVTCDRQDFSYLLSEEERRVTKFIHHKSEKVWANFEGGIDFAFLDFFSDPTMKVTTCLKEIEICISRMKTNGILAIHDATSDRYPVARAMELISANSEIETLSLPFNYGLGLIRKKGRSKWGVIHDRFLKKQDSKPGDIDKEAGRANALKWTLKAIQRDSTNPALFNNLGVLLSGENPDQAVMCFKKALLIKPDFAEADHNLSLVSNRLERTGQPIKSLEKEAENV